MKLHFISNLDKFKYDKFHSNKMINNGRVGKLLLFVGFFYCYSSNSIKTN